MLYCGCCTVQYIRYSLVTVLVFLTLPIIERFCFCLLLNIAVLYSIFTSKMNNTSTNTLLCSTVLETNRFTSEHTSLGMSWILEASQTVPDLAISVNSIACNSLFYSHILSSFLYLSMSWHPILP